MAGRGSTAPDYPAVRSWNNRAVRAVLRHVARQPRTLPRAQLVVLSEWMPPPRRRKSPSPRGSVTQHDALDGHVGALPYVQPLGFQLEIARILLWHPYTNGHIIAGLAESRA